MVKQKQYYVHYHLVPCKKWCRSFKDSSIEKLDLEGISGDHPSQAQGRNIHV